MIEFRFWSKVRISAGCWLWQAATDEKGYGRFGFQGRNARAHRVAFCLAFGVTLLESDVIMHACDTPSCVNPAHLRRGTVTDNNRDRDEKGRCRAGIRNREKVCCLRGHEFTPENTRWRLRTDGMRRECLACAHLRSLAEYRRARRAA